VANHLSYWDVFALGLLLPRPLNYVARASLFFPPLAAILCHKFSCKCMSIASIAAFK
jgi:1-acyl-sn-glycerol-3-phosphate acyltransferase